MNLHGLRILDFKTSHSKSIGNGALRKEPDILMCEKKENQTIDKKKTDDQNISHKTHKSSSRKFNFLQRRTSSEIFRNPLKTKVKDQTPKNISCEDLKAKFKEDKVNQHSRFNFFNKDSILNLHLKGGDVKKSKNSNKPEYDTTVLFDGMPRNKTSANKLVKNKALKQREKNMLLDDTFGFLKNHRSITSCYRQNNNFINLDQCLLGLKKLKKRKANNTRVPSVFGRRPRHKKKVTKQCTCVHNPLKILTYDSSGCSNIVTPNSHISEGNLGGTSAQEFKTGYKSPDNKTTGKNPKVSKFKSASKKKTAERKGPAAECKCPPSNYWEKQLEPKNQIRKDAFVSVSSSSLDPKVYCGCDAAVGTDQNKFTTRKRSKAEYKCCHMKRNTPQVLIDSCKPDENPQSHNYTIKKERLKELVKEERNTFFTDFLNDMVDFRIGQTKHRFPVQCMKYICLGLLVIVWSPCLLALFLGRVIMCPQRIPCSPQLLKQMQTNSNCTWNVKNKRSLNEIHRKENPMNTPVNYVKCLPAKGKGFKKNRDKSLPTECQQTKMQAHSLSHKTKRKCSVTRDERPQGSSNILINYLRNKIPISECPRPQKSNYVKNRRQKKFMSSVASWCTRTVTSFGNVVSVVKLIGFRLPTGTRTSLNTTQRNRCSLYYSNGRGWIVKPQVVQNMRCEYSPDLRLSTSSKDCIFKPKSKVSFSEQLECPRDCVINRTCTSKADPDSHYSTVLFGNYQTTNQQVNIKPKQLTTRVEYPSKEGTLRSCKHQQMPTKKNMFNPHNEPKYVVVPLHGIVIGYPGGSGYYYPKEQMSKQNNKKKLLSIVKKKETYHNKPGHTAVDKVAYHISKKNPPIQPSHKILHSKSRRVERASTNNHACQRYLISSKIRANKKRDHKCNYSSTDRQVNIKAKSTNAFDGAFQSSHMKHLANAMEEKISHLTHSTLNKLDNTKKIREYMMSDKTGCNSSSIKQLNAKQSEFLKSKKTSKSVVSFVETVNSVDKTTKKRQSTSKMDFINNRTSKLSSKQSSTFHISPEIKTKNKSMEFERPFEKMSNPYKSIKKNRKLPLNKISEQSHNIRDQKHHMSSSFGTAKQKSISPSFERASNKVQKNGIPTYYEKSVQPRAINTNMLLDKYAEHTSGTLFKKSQNVVCPSHQEGSYTVYCARDSIKRTVSSMTLFDQSQKRRKPSLTTNLQYDKSCSNVQSLNSFHYQTFSEGLKKYIVMSKSRRHNQSKLTQYRTNKAPRYRCNSLYPETYSKQSTNLTEFDSFQKLAIPTQMKPFLRNSPQNSNTYLRQKKQILAYTSPQRFLTSYRKEYPLKSRQFMKKSLSSITDASSYLSQSLPSQKLSPLSTLNDNLIFSPRYSSSLFRKSVVMGQYDCSCMHTSRSFQSILCKFKSYDEYEYKNKQKPSISIPCKPLFKQNLQLYLNLKNNTIDQSRRSLCTSSPKKLLNRKKHRRIAHLCGNNSAITKNELNTSLKKRLRYLDKFLGNNTAPFECFNKNNCAPTRKTENRSYKSEELKMKCLRYSENHDNCIACKTSYLIGKIQLLRQLLGKVALQEKSHETRTKGIRSPKCLPSLDWPQKKQNDTYKRVQKSHTKLLGNSPLCIQKKQGLQPIYYQKTHRPLECACDWFYQTLDCPVMATQMHQCTSKCFQNLLDYLHLHRQGKGSSRSKRIRSQAISNCPIICSWVKCKNNCKQTKRQLSPQDNLMRNSDKKRKTTNLSKGGIKLNCSNCKKKKICSPKIEKEKKTKFLINNKETTLRKKTKDKRIQKRTNCPCMHKRCSSKKKRKKNKSTCKCKRTVSPGNEDKKTRKFSEKDKMKRRDYPQAKPKMSRSIKNMEKRKNEKRKNTSKSKKQKTKRKTKTRTRSFPICLVDLVQTMREAEAKAFPLDVDCECLYIQTMKKRPCLWIYNLWPSVYPRFLRLRRLIKRIGTCLVLCLCSPLLSCSYCCIEIVTYCIKTIICYGC